MDDKLAVTKKLNDFFKKDEVIFREGDKGNEMYIIQSGKVEVIKDTGKEQVVLATLKPKAFFGEMALFGDPYRSATVRAAEDTKMIVINKEILDSQLQKVPEWFVSILKTLISRLRETNKRIKSRFNIGAEFSILKTIYFLMKSLEKSSNEGLSLKKACDECCNVLAISEEEFNKKLKTLMFVRLVKFSEPKDLLLIPDENMLKDFLAFLRSKSDEDEKKEEESEIFADEKSNIMFEKIYKLLSHKKL